MNDTVDLSELPEDIRNEIVEKRRKALEPKFGPIGPRQYDAPFSTREQKEMASKIDELIEQWNLLMRERSAKKEAK